MLRGCDIGRYECLSAVTHESLCVQWREDSVVNNALSELNKYLPTPYDHTATLRCRNMVNRPTLFGSFKTINTRTRAQLELMAVEAQQNTH